MGYLHLPIACVAITATFLFFWEFSKSNRVLKSNLRVLNKARDICWYISFACSACSRYSNIFWENLKRTQIKLTIWKQHNLEVGTNFCWATKWLSWFHLEYQLEQSTLEQHRTNFGWDPKWPSGLYLEYHSGPKFDWNWNGSGLTFKIFNDWHIM